MQTAFRTDRRSGREHPRFFYFIAILCCVAAVVFSAAMASKESVVLSYGPQTDLVHLGKIQRGEAEPGFSAYANKRLLLSCLYGIVSVYGLASTPAAHMQFAQNCLAIADKVLEQSPTMSFAWEVRAAANGVLGDFSSMNNDLVASWRTGPNEQWVAEHRSNTAETYLSKLDAEARRAHEQDLAILVLSNSGIASIAQRYMRQPDFRERITEIVSKMSDQDQRRFVGSVRRAAQNRTQSN
jgi:hypothetical protein